jgi:nicotinamidase/pyrazinamidase
MTTNLYQPSDVERFYDPRAIEFVSAGEANPTPVTAFNDRRKVALLIVDAQRDFVIPGLGLPVDGAVADMRRLIEFIYRYIGDITSIHLSMDTHLPFQIFFPTWWRDPKGQMPSGYTPISYADIKSGAWKPAVDPRWSIDYVKMLEARAKKSLMIWPFHCLQGTPGHAIVPALQEAVLYHSAARRNQPEYLTKGTNARTEHYGIFAAEITDPKDPSTQLNTRVLDMIAKNDLIYVAGEAKSHCVLETMHQLVGYFGQTDADAIKKIRFLMDCTSSVKHPAVDFDGLANAELDKMVAQGVVLTNSTDPIR